MAQPRILLVDDEESMIRFLSIMLAKEGYEIRAVSSGKQALRELQQWRADLVISDIRMPEMDGIQLLAGIKAIDASIPVILLTAYASQETAIEAVNKGAFHYLIKQARNDEIKMVVRNALAMREVRSENTQLRRQLQDDSSLESIIGSSEAMQRIFAVVRKIAATDSTILIGGESGTGKELIARAIHFMSGRADKPFVGVNCGALPENLLESELFGHVKGSFTGAIRDKEGLFKVAESGTIFLDEVGEITPALQVKLLRALQEREFLPVGGTQPVKVDVRVLAATNRDLEEEVERGTFRADLYYRLNVIPLTVPPLRERREDVPLLVRHFIQRLAEKRGLPMKGITRDAMELLCEYDWPGNVRELENVLERMVLLEERDSLDRESLPEKLLESPDRSPKAFFEGKPRATLEELEKEYLLQVLESTGWQKKKASAILGINASTLYRKIQRYGLEPQREMAQVD
ncbi:MAG: sigma-54 dependent transcriptional regulator [Candidatus Krumholzibacteriia bacterium]|nr:sigma-54-dependent Fis family transcriptional regulator [Candidatus Latescibacterota bacterium]